jgi:hypothetical protein
MEDDMVKMSEETQSPEQREELVPIARSTLDEVPGYLEHVAGLMASSGNNLRAGNDSAGLNDFARGASDLALLVELVQRLTAVSGPNPSKATDAFASGMAESVRFLDQALTRHDLVALGDGIEGQLLPVLDSWEAVDRELRDALAARA